MAYTDFTLTRDKPPCTNCAHCSGGCKIRTSCLLWADWELRKSARYEDLRRARQVQVDEFSISRGTFRRALARKAVGR
jgi:hypothetical protein